jgi:hypothetical protein
MKKYQIWERENWGWQERGILIPAEEITDMVYAENESWYQIEGITENVDALVERLTAAYLAAVDADEDFEIADNDDLERFLQDTGIEFGNISFVPDFAQPENVLCYDMYHREFFNLSSIEIYPVYRWWDGSNWKHVFGDDESVTVTEITVEDESTSLDEWDGNNMTCGGKGLHQQYYKVLELDGQSVQDMYLLEYWSQWQGDHATAEVLTKNELNEHIADLTS